MQTLYRLLGFDPTKHNLRTELMAGLTTFLTMSYILAVNPDILSSTGMDKGAVFTATALASALGTVLIAFLAKLPFAQAPGMGINAFFAFTLVAGMGYSWQTALAAVFVEGVIFILLTAFNVREQIVHCIPKTLRFAISAGIGFFIAFIGLKNSGIIVKNPATLVALGPFTPVSTLAAVGIVLSAVLMKLRVRGACEGCSRLRLLLRSVLKSLRGLRYLLPEQGFHQRRRRLLLRSWRFRCLYPRFGLPEWFRCCYQPPRSRIGG